MLSTNISYLNAMTSVQEGGLMTVMSTIWLTWGSMCQQWLQQELESHIVGKITIYGLL